MRDEAPKQPELLPEIVEEVGDDECSSLEDCVPAQEPFDCSANIPVFASRNTVVE